MATTPSRALDAMRPDAIGRRFTSRLHDPRTASLLGIALGVTFTVCFATGLLSHLFQQPPHWLSLPTRPANLYRVSQGVHTITGFVSIPLLLAKLWSVFSKLFEWPPARSIAHGLERLSLLPLVGGSLFLLMSGTANLARWYPWSFFFTAAHYVVAWITVGALAIHLGAKWATVRTHVGPRRVADDDDPGLAGAIGRDRRRFLAGVGGTVGLVFLATAGNTVSALSRVAALAQRRPGVGPQGLPVNKSAKGAGVERTALDPAYRLVVDGRGRRTRSFSLEDLRALPQHEAELPIACVEGWSTSARWRGVRVASLVEQIGIEGFDRVRITSIQRGGRYRRSELTAEQVADADTLLALEVNGETLHIDHGYPARLIAPGRPGVLQTKWVQRIEVRGGRPT
jgi:DMSO/TMAO reductase YedYZ molybdopterin-dependent catalytic subunit